MSWSLHMRWLWLEKTDTSHPWRGLEIKVHANTVPLFNVALQLHVGNGASTLFWSDRWLLGGLLSVIAPDVMVVPLKLHNLCMVADALLDQSWSRDVEGGLSMTRLFEYFQLWDILRDFMLSHEVDRQLRYILIKICLSCLLSRIHHF
jgi:hypothetical protein